MMRGHFCTVSNDSLLDSLSRAEKKKEQPLPTYQCKSKCEMALVTLVSSDPEGMSGNKENSTAPKFTTHTFKNVTRKSQSSFRTTE